MGSTRVSRWQSIVVAFSMVAALVVITPHESAFAATLTVDPSDPGCLDADPSPNHCTIGGAILNAANGDVIQVAPGVYPETLSISKSVLILGLGEDASEVVIDASGIVQSNGAVSVGGAIESALENLTITGALTQNPNPSFASLGGGITVSSGSLTLLDVRVTGNRTVSNGGGVHARGTLASVVIYNSTIDNNVAGSNGAGVYITDGATAEIYNSTISGNTDGPEASSTGAVNVRSGSSLLMNHSTVVDNDVAGFNSGVVVDGGGVATIANSVLANNVGRDCSGSFTDSSGYNLVETVPVGDCTLLVGSTSIEGVDPDLGPLADNGGATPTHLPSQTSPALDSAFQDSGLSCSEFDDQRGLARPSGFGCDIGSVELQVEVATPLQDLIDASGGEETIVVPPGVYNEAIIIGGDITLVGGGDTAADTVIDASGLGNRTVTLFGNAGFENLTITGGVSDSQGGNILNDSAELTLTDVVVANGTASDGGGIFSSGILTISGSTIVGNSATSGSGGGIGGLGTIDIVNSTIQGNSASASGGGLGLVSGTARVNNVTLVGNSAGGSGAAFNAAAGTIEISNSLSANNSSDGGPNCATLVSLGHNVLGGDPGCLLADSDIVDPDADLLGPLAFNGGRTPTRALLDGNPALDAGSTRSYPAFDNSNIGDWQLNGYTTLRSGELVLAEAAPDFTAGSAYLTDPIDVTEDFSADFQFRIDPDADSEGADGITFTITDSPTDLGGAGGFLGIGGSPAPVAGVSVEFDTWLNGDGEGANDAGSLDPDNHIGINEQGSLSSVAFNTLAIADLSDSSVWTARVEYDASTGTFDVYASNTETLPASPTVSTVLSLDIFSLLDVPAGFVGFTGATGTEDISGTHQVLNFGFDNGPACESVDQRGVSRPQGSRCDVGAFELEVTPAGTVLSELEVNTFEDTTLESGFSVALDAIPSDRLLAGASAIVGAPLGAIELDARVDAAPLGAIGLDATPLGAIPLGAIPLGAIPLGAIPLGAINLMDLPIDGGWDAVLAGTTLEGRPPQTVTIEEVFDEVPADRLAEVRLAQLDPTSSAFGDISVGSLLLGTVPISDLDTDGTLLAACADVAGGSCPADASPLSLELSGSSLTASPLGAIPLGAIPLGAIPLGAIGTEAAPLGAIPLGAIPLGAIPLGAIGDIQSAPLGAIPLGAIGDLAAAPLGAIPLGAIPLGAIQLGAIPLGAIPLGAIPLGAIDANGDGTVGDVCSFLDADPSAQSCSDLGLDDNSTLEDYVDAVGAGDLSATPLGAIPLGAIPLGAIPLGAIEMTGIPLGAIQLGAIELAGTPLGAIPLGAIPLGAIQFGDVCAAVTDTTVACDEDLPLSDYLAATGASTLDATPLGAITLEGLPLGAIPLGAIPLGAISIAGVPLGAIPLGAIDLQSSPLGAIQLQDTPLGAIGDTTTLAEAIPLGAIPAETPLGAIDEALDGYFLEDVLDHLTIAFLGETGAFADLTLADVLVGILLASDFPWEDLPLDQIEVRDVACAAESFDVGEGDFLGAACIGDVDTLDVGVDFLLESGDLGGVEARVTLPSDWAYLADSAWLDSGDLFDVEPKIEGADLVFLLPDTGAAAGSTITLRFSVYAGYQLGTGVISATVTGQDGPDLNATSPTITVVDGLEPSSLGAPTGITDDTLYVGYVGTSTDVDGFSIPSAGAGFRTTVFLSNLDQDVDTFIYRPEGAPLSGDGTERAIPLGSTPVSDNIDFGGDSPLEPEVQGDSPVSAPADTVLADSSTNTGTGGEELTILDAEGETYTIQVAGFQGASSDRPYTLRVKRTAEAAQPTTCLPRIAPSYTALSGGGATIDSDTVSLFLTNPSRFDDIYGAGSWNIASAQLATLAARPEVGGQIVDIADIPGVVSAFNAWDADPCDVSAANDIVGAIQVWIQDNAPDSLRHITIMGADEVVPFARAEDETVVANESTYAGEFDASPLFSALTTRHYLTDAPYGDFDPIPWVGTKYAYVTDLSVGRLVENATHIAGAIQTYIDNGGVLSPTTAAVASYDFLYDGATLLADRLDGQLGGPVTDRTLMDDPTTVTLPGDAWTSLDLEALIDGVPDIISPNSHYDHHRLLPSQENLNETEANLFTIDDLPGDLSDVIIFTMGCHSGLNVDGSIGTATEDRDWPEVYSALNAIYIGNTGYGYGDSATIALTESIMANLAGNLNGTFTIGQALTQAKQDQFSKAGLYGVYDLKAIEEATLYGLPFWQIDVPGNSVADPDPTAGPIGTDPISELTAASFSIAPEFDLVNSVNGDYYAVGGEVEYLQWRPIQPRTGVDVTKDGLIATGAIFTDLVTSDNTIADVAFARPMTVSSTLREPEVETPGIVFPTGFTTVGTGNRVNPDPTGPAVEQVQRLNLIPGQFQGNPTGSGGVQRLFEEIDGTVFYQPAANLGSIDWTRPFINDVDATTSGNQVQFTVDTNDPDSAVSRVVVLYRSGATTWTSVDLAQQGTSATWIGGGLFGAVTPPLDYFVFSVNDDGVTSVSTFKGGLYETQAGPPPGPGDPVEINGTPGIVPGVYSSPVEITGPVGRAVTVDGTSFTLPVTVSSDGPHEVVVADGPTLRFVVDQTNPTVTVPTASPQFDPGQVVSQLFTCADAVTLVVFCGAELATPGGGTVAVSSEALLPTSTPGVYSGTARAVDSAGNEVAATFEYVVRSAPFILEFISPNEPIPQGSTAVLTVRFTDPGNDAHSIVFDWGDGNETTVTLAPGAGTNGVKEASAAKPYFLPGVYPVSVTVTDDDGAEATESTFVVVFDLEGRQVSGNGRANLTGTSAVLDGASVEADLDFGASIKAKDKGLSGKFDFELDDPDKGNNNRNNSSNGNNGDDDELEFEFEATSISNFYVFNGWAVALGSGEIDDRPGIYQWLLSVRDDDPDLIRIRITDSTGTVVFDTQPGASTFAQPNLPLDKGKIKIKAK